PPDDRLSITVRTPGGVEYGPIDWKGTGDFDTAEGHIYIANAQGGVDAISGRNGMFCSVQQSEKALVASGRWEIVLRGTTPRWVWGFPGKGRPTAVAVRGELAADDHLTIPACAEDILSAASWTPKPSWPSFLGANVTRLLPVGAPSAFSSPGPTADGR